MSRRVMVAWPFCACMVLWALTSVAQERVISKTDADMIFAFTRRQWEAHAIRLTVPNGWSLRLMPHSTGTSFAAYDRSTGIGLSVQPLYSDAQGPPTAIVVGSWYPPGTFPITDAVVKHTEHGARLDLGPAYDVTAKHAQMAGTDMGGIELFVTRRAKK